MKPNEYFKIVNEYLDHLNDSEFHQLLVVSGLDKCPLEDEIHESLVVNTVYKKSFTYDTGPSQYNLEAFLKVA